MAVVVSSSLHNSDMRAQPALRTIRSVPLLRAEVAAGRPAAAMRVRSWMAKLPTRGRCADEAAAAAMDVSVLEVVSEVALNTAWCPPGTARAAEIAETGTACWARPLGWLPPGPSSPSALLRRKARPQSSSIDREDAAAAAAAPPAVLAALSRSNDSDTARMALARPQCPKAFLAAAAARRPEGRLSSQTTTAISNPACPAAFVRAATRGWGQERLSAARNPRCDPDMLRALAADGGSPTVAEAAAGNPALPADAFETLAADEESLVELDSLAAHPSCPPHVLRALSEYRDVRDTVIANSACPEDLFAELIEPLLADTASGRSDIDGLLAQALASSPWCPPELLSEAAYRSADAATAAASNPAAGPKLLSELAGRSIFADRNLASNRNCPPWTLAALAESVDQATATAVAANPNCPLALLARLASRHTEVGVVAAAVAAVAARTRTLALTRQRRSAQGRSG